MAVLAKLSSSAALVAAKETIAIERKGLQALEDSLGADFEKMVAHCLEITGRIIVTGMGKSGHVARKIAASLSSTGTPALFIHPAEASHGDLGMVQENDLIIMLSNSGEAPELADMIAYSRRFHIPLAAMTRKADSTLANAADHILLVPATPEACPMGMAPTTSTTQMMALGDALVVALMRARGFTKDDYRNFHPGGKLGQRLLRVRNLMHQGEAMPVVKKGTMMKDALLIMTSKCLGCVGIVDDNNHLAGIITDGDLRRHLAEDFWHKSVNDIMTQNPQTTTPDLLAAEAVAQMNIKGITMLFVIGQDRTPLGVIHLHDCLKAGVA